MELGLLGGGSWNNWSWECEKESHSQSKRDGETVCEREKPWCVWCGAGGVRGYACKSSVSVSEFP